MEVVAELLKDRRFYFTEYEGHNCPVLHCASANGQVALIKELLAGKRWEGADPDEDDEERRYYRCQ